MRTGWRERVRKCMVAICTDKNDDQSRSDSEVGKKKCAKNRPVWLKKKVTVHTFFWFWARRGSDTTTEATTGTYCACTLYIQYVERCTDW